MRKHIKKVAVLGSGVMGSRIACHFANIGVEVLLLDIVPRDLSEENQKNPAKKNKIVNDALAATLKANPSAIYNKKWASRITTGNFDDDLSKIAEVDWILEAIIENLEIKKSLFEKVEQYRKPGTYISSNTSGIPINSMLEGRSDDFKQYFCGTHFFNPPRYLQLLEIIPTAQTKSEVVDFFMHYGDRYLGKTTVLCKDTPAFIANRVGIFAILKVVETMQQLGLSIDEVDKLTGPVIGRPKSATFRTSDVVGLDTLIKVADGLYQNLPDDESRELFKLPDVVRTLEKNGWLGEKSGQGFYKKVKKDGKSHILTLDLESMEYGEKKKVSFPTLELTKPIDKVKDRFKTLFAGKDKAGDFYRHSFYGLFQYVTNRIPEISDELYRIDDAICAGFGWEAGPFETWDAADLKKTVEKMEELNYKPAQWVYDLLDKGFTSFYKVEDGKKYYYDIPSGDYKLIPGIESFIILEQLTHKVWSNVGTSIYDLGDGILNLEFHTKMNTIGTEIFEGIHKAIDLAEQDYKGLVIANNGQNFSAGANLGLIFMYAIEQEYDEIDFMIRQFQRTTMRLRYSSIPVVVAPHGLTLGGGCELTLHADHVQAAAETYIGLVEVGVGLIPGGGGTKEMTLRVNDRLESGDVELNALQNTFMNIAMGKVATSAEEGRDMHFLKKSDSVTVHPHRRIADAKAAALLMAEEGYSQPIERKDIKVQGKTGIAMFLAGVEGMRIGNYISDHDKKIATKIAHVMCGGDLSYPHQVSEQYLLDLEREAFLSLTAEPKTLERMQAILKGGKPLRN